MEIDWTMTYWIVLRITLIFCEATCKDINLDCAKSINVTSPNYPFNYLPGVYKRWNINVPSSRRILVTFNDFSTKDNADILELVDMTDNRNRLEYTGEDKQFPHFLTRGSGLQVTFTFRGLGTKRGFNLSVSCYIKSDDTAGRLIGGTSPSDGYLNIPTMSGDSVRICENNLSTRVAAVLCGELGYPGVKEVSYDPEGCKMDGSGKECTTAPNCGDRAYIFDDCTRTNGSCSTYSAVMIKCFEPGYKGCYQTMRFENGSIHQSTAQCVSLCNQESSRDIAVVHEGECFCSTADEVKLSTLTPVKDDNCNQRVNRTDQDLFYAVYDVSVGFCDPLEVTNGSINTPITWFGTIVNVTCDGGYSLNGSETLQCVPRASPYHPIWTGDIPTCDYNEGHIETTTTSSNEDAGTSKNNAEKRFIYSIIISVIVFVLLVAVTVALKVYCR